MAQASLRGAFDGADDAGIGAAAADIGAHMFDDLGAVGLRIMRQQVGGAHDLAGLAVAALRHPFGEPGLLHRMGGIRSTAPRWWSPPCPRPADTWVWHEKARLPSIWTMQAPHRPVPQPNLVPVSLSSSRITHSSGVCGGASDRAALPLMLKSNAIGSSIVPGVTAQRRRRYDPDISVPKCRDISDRSPASGKPTRTNGNHRFGRTIGSPDQVGPHGLTPV